MLRRMYYIGLMSILAVFSLLNMSGFGDAYHSDIIIRCVVYVFALFTFFIVQSKSEKICNKKDIIFFMLVILCFEGSSIINGFSGYGLQYLSFYICVYVVAMQEGKEEYMFYTSCIFAVFGTGLLSIIKFTSVLSRWNQNTLAILCFQSFLLFFAACNVSSLSRKVIYLSVSAINMILLAILDCRSSMLCLFLILLLDLIPNAKKILEKKYVLYAFVIAPLIIALFVVLLSNLPIADALNDWSIQHFQKTFFNGRDEIWSHGFTELAKKPLFGSGEIYSGYWHNSAVACLFSYGIVGYVLYVIIFLKILNYTEGYLYDTTLSRCVLAFLVLNFQQGFENTLFVPNGMYLPYILLGLIIARTRYVKRKNKDEKVEPYYSHI